jgi:glycosyltransferase involved in cell wall biosynthesis
MQGIVVSVGWQADVLPYLAASDLLLHVAQFEGLPFVVIEAMAAGVACAVTQDLALEIPLFNKNNVLFIDDLSDLAQKVRNRVDLARIGSVGRDLVEKNFSLKRMAESYEQVYVCAIRGN